VRPLGELWTDPGIRMNEGDCDPDGRFYCGTMAYDSRPGAGSVYRLDHDGTVTTVLTGVTISNGLAWSPDSRTMYFTDSFLGSHVWAYDFDPDTAEIANRRVFADLSDIDAIVDGATVDAEGCYWLTVPFKGKVRRYDPDGSLMTTIELPVDLPTCCEFGGKDLDILYVTSAVLKRPASHFVGQKNPGGLFALDVGVKGLALPAFKG
jgi:sugar lactone lactonase YvrE